MVDVETQRCDAFNEGLMSMVPVGAFVPWSEALELAKPFGWTPAELFSVAEMWQSPDAAEMHLRDASLQDPSARVRLLFRLDVDPDVGVVTVSVSSEEENMT